MSTFPPIAGISPFAPVSNVTPFTYRDGETFLSQLHRLCDYVKDSVEFLELADDANRDYVNTTIAQIMSVISSLENNIGNFHDGYSPIDYLTTDATSWDSATPQQQHDALAAACTAASAGNGGGIIKLPMGITHIVGSFPLAGYRLGGFIGYGTSYSLSDGMIGSTVVATNQTGPVLDFTGMKFPDDYMAKMPIGNFGVVGDGTPDASSDGGGIGGITKMGVKIGHSDLVTDPYPIGLTIFNIAVTNTGGTGFYAKDMYLAEVTGIVVSDPVSGVANNVPWTRWVGCNGTKFIGVGHRSTDHTEKAAHVATVPAAGVCRTEWSTLVNGFMFHRAAFIGTWFENIFVGNNNAIFSAATCQVKYQDTEYFDCFKISGANNTYFFAFNKSLYSDSGGNIYEGIVEGRYNADPQSVDYGINVVQSYNRINGVKGYQGNNVFLNAGVLGTSVNLTGSAGNAIVAGVVDNSGNATNTIHDDTLGIHQFGSLSGVSTVTVNGQPIIWNSVNIAVNSASFNPNLNVGQQYFWCTLSYPSPITCNAPTNVGTNPKPITIALIQDSVGGRTIGNWNPIYKFAGGVFPTLSTTPGSVDIFTFIYDGTNWREMSRSIGTK